MFAKIISGQKTIVRLFEHPFPGTDKTASSELILKKLFLCIMLIFILRIPYSILHFAYILFK